MPIFEYKCNTCGHVTEVLEKAGSKKKHVCEKCGSTQMEKMLSVFRASVPAGSTSGSGSCPTGTCSL